MIGDRGILKGAFFIVGPTASGKSELAADVAARCGAEVVSADAFQIYRGLPLLTAQPDEATLRKARHHLVETVSPEEEMSAARFRELALNALRDIHGRGKLAIVAGGSGLYLKALTHGLAPLPAVDQKLRAELDALSLEELQARLLAVDPLGAETIDRKNKRRLVRALEIFAQTRRPASEQRQEWSQEVSDLQGVFVFRERPELYARIDRRVEEMFRNGVTDEVARLGEVSVTAAKTLGLEEIRHLLEGKVSQEECVAAIQLATRRYAKRQLTWFRRQPSLESLNLSSLKDHAAAVDWILQKVSLLPPLE
ncbi:MAG: tRNA (adenosine(37)-N6)-dimethylallyltransferase MiaA [Verrucomicrobiota bacterium]|nr:tRNA (adenosine(37)-N6)-dimethylallyltransferase MiaA [Verrucomicrobiota bacterium]